MHGRFVSVGGTPPPTQEIMANLLGYFSNDIGIDLGTVHRWKEPESKSPSGMRKTRGTPPED